MLKLNFQYEKAQSCNKSQQSQFSSLLWEESLRQIQMFHGLSKLLSNSVLEHLQFFIISIKPNFHWDYPSSLSPLYKPAKSLGDPWQQLLSLQCLLGNSCCVKAKSSSCSVEIDILGVAECKCGRTNLPRALPGGWGAQPSISSSSHQDEALPRGHALAGKAASSGALAKGILSDKPQPDPSVGFEVQHNPPCAPQEGPRCQVHNQGKLLLVCSSLALSKVHPWLPSLLFSPEIFLLIPSQHHRLIIGTMFCSSQQAELLWVWGGGSSHIFYLTFSPKTWPATGSYFSFY